MWGIMLFLLLYRQVAGRRVGWGAKPVDPPIGGVWVVNPFRAMSAKPVSKGDAIDFNIETMTVEQGLHLFGRCTVWRPTTAFREAVRLLQAGDSRLLH